MRKVAALPLLLLVFALPTDSLAVVGPMTQTVTVRPTPAFTTGQFRSNVQVRSANRLFVTVSLVVQAKTAGTGEFYASECSSEMYVLCSDQQGRQSFDYQPGLNRIRWRETIVSPAPIDSASFSVYDSVDSGSAAAFTAHILAG